MIKATKLFLLTSIALLFVVACSSPSEDSASSTSGASTYFTQAKADARYKALTAFTDAEVAKYGAEYGDNDGDWVLINTQGGANPYLFTLAVKDPSSGVWFSEEDGIVNDDWFLKYKAYNVHQVQTRDFADNSIVDLKAKPITFTPTNKGTELQNLTTDLSLSRAEEIDAKSIEWLGRFIKHFDEKGKKVVVIGSSFGGFMVHELIAQYGTDSAEIFIAAVGRLDMNTEIVEKFKKGTFTEFRYPSYTNAGDLTQYPKGSDITKQDVNETLVKWADNLYGKVPADLTDEELAITNKVLREAESMSRLNAGLGQRRYTEVLADYDLGKLLDIWSYVDKSTGNYSLAEVKFLKDKKVNSVSFFDNHNHPITVDRLLNNIRINSATSMDKYLEGVYVTEMNAESSIPDPASSNPDKPDRLIFDQFYYNADEAYAFALGGAAKS